MAGAEGPVKKEGEKEKEEISGGSRGERALGRRKHKRQES